MQSRSSGPSDTSARVLIMLQQPRLTGVEVKRGCAGINEAAIAGGLFCLQLSRTPELAISQSP
jgi:hypothetical protein